MTYIPINELLVQIDRDYNQSIMTVRQLMSNNAYNAAEKRMIAYKIINLVDKMKSEILPWTTI